MILPGYVKVVFVRSMKFPAGVARLMTTNSSFWLPSVAGVSNTIPVARIFVEIAGDDSA
jgi:hypothetical protein